MKRQGRRQSQNLVDTTIGEGWLGTMFAGRPAGHIYDLLTRPETQSFPETEKMISGIDRITRWDQAMTENPSTVSQPSTPTTRPSAEFMSSGKTKGRHSRSRSRSRARTGRVATDAMNYAIDRFGQIGMNRTQAIGALASLAGESGLGLDPDARNPNDPGTSEGIGQWNNSGKKSGRKSSMKSYVSSWAEKRGLTPSTMTRLDKQKAQIDFHARELQTTHRNALARIKEAKTAAAATRAHTKYYEAPLVDNSAVRAKNIGTIEAALSGRITHAPQQSVSGATVTPDDASIQTSGTTVTSKEDIAWGGNESKPKEHKSIFGSIVDSLSSVGDEALGVGTNAVDKATENTKEKTGFLDGDVNFGTIAGSIAGGLVGGPIGSMLGGVLGNAVHNLLSRDPEDATDSILGDDEDGLLGGLSRSLDSLGADISSSFGGSGGDRNTNTAGHDHFGGGEVGGFGASFGGRSSSSTNQSGGRGGKGVHGLGESEQAGGNQGSPGSQGYGRESQGRSKEKAGK